MGKQRLFGRGLRLRIFVTIACEMAFMLMGYDQGVLSSVVSNEDFLDKIDHPDDVHLGIIVATYNLGCLSGSILTFFLSEKLGRRRSMWLAMSFILVGATLQATAFTRAHFVVGRYICGIGTGIDTSTVPISELLFVGVGIVTAYWFNYGMNFAAGSESWRLPIAFQTVYALITIVVVFGIPESPRYLCKIDHFDEALEVLSAVWDKPKDDPAIRKEHDDIVTALAIEREHGEYKWSQLHKSDRVHTTRRVVLAYVINFMNQMAGINMIVYFMPTVLQQNVGLSANISQVLGGCINLMFPIGALFPTFRADTYGRRKTMMWGSFGLGCCMMMIAILLSFRGKSAEKPTSNAAVAFFFLYMLIFGGSVNCIPWVYGPEILPLHARAKGNALAVSAIWLWNFFVVMITPVVINRIQWKSYLIFTVLNFSFIPVLYLYFPETRNLTLEEMDQIFTQGMSPVKAAERLRAEKDRRAQEGGSPDTSVVEVHLANPEKE
ncbi:hypothetical protein CLAIMM_05912 [Cladophialophora immunda]|nr:hypothetical protein CLAIMM_05912 [Cladophialophora immunda]